MRPAMKPATGFQRPFFFCSARNSAASSSADPVEVAVLAALNLADEYMRTTQDLRALDDEVERIGAVLLEAGALDVVLATPALPRDDTMGDPVAAGAREGNARRDEAQDRQPVHDRPG